MNQLPYYRFVIVKADATGLTARHIPDGKALSYEEICRTSMKHSHLQRIFRQNFEEFRNSERQTFFIDDLTLFLRKHLILQKYLVDELKMVQAIETMSYYDDEYVTRILRIKGYKITPQIIEEYKYRCRMNVLSYKK